MNRITPTQKFMPFLILFLAILLSDCHRRQGGEEEDASHEPVKAVVSVKLGFVREHDAEISVTAFGKTDALRKEKVYSPVAGKIVSLKVFEGSGVKKGDVVAVLQSRESNAAILGAETVLRSATTPEQKAEGERMLALARSTQNSVNVLAKFDGVVSARNVSEGELVVENAELLTLLDPSTIDFLADVHLHDIASVREGEEATVVFQSIAGKKFSAVVEAVNPQSDAQSQTVRVRLRFLQTSRLRTEMAGTATIVAGIHPHSLFVPKSALLRNDETNTSSVVTLTADSLAKSIAVVPGGITDSTVEVTSPDLRPGMPVVTEGNYLLADSTRATLSRPE